MMVNYSSLKTSPEDIISMLLEHYNKIKDNFNKNTEILAIDYSLNNMDLMLDSLNKLADMLRKIHYSKKNTFFYYL